MDKNEIFIQKSILLHSNKYDYTYINYIDNIKKVEIICKEHGSFFQSPRDHLNNCGCPECGAISSNLKRSNLKWKEDFIKKHGDIYDYSKVFYINSRTKVEIICRKHGSFFQRPMDHKKGRGCPKCGKLKCVPKKSNKWLENFKKVHGDTYDYTNFKYIKCNIKGEIICKKHGSFLQTPSSHISGSGCPKCKISKGERRIMNFLNQKKINFEMNYSFEDCKFKNKLPFDFYLPDNKICIEYDGIQHFESIEYFGGDLRLKNQSIKDDIKNKYCLENNIQIIRISYKEYNIIEDILSEKLTHCFSISL